MSVFEVQGFKAGKQQPVIVFSESLIGDLPPPTDPVRCTTGIATQTIARLIIKRKAPPENRTEGYSTSSAFSSQTYTLLASKT